MFNKFTKTAVLFFIFVFSFQTVDAQLTFITNDATEVEAKVRSYFADIPSMIDIAKCESGFRQLGSNGSILRGGLGGSMIGIFQINESVHINRAREKGIDIYSLDGNMAYARFLYEQSGVQPWISCVKPGAATASVKTPVVNMTSPNVVAAGDLNMNLGFGMVNNQVKMLQQKLNAKGFKVAEGGAGSPGNETTKFGLLTKEAVKRFQCEMKIVCDGNEDTTGYGWVGPRTRAKINE